MSWNAPSMLRRVRSLPTHLHELAANLSILSRETQERIAETVATTIAQIVRDGLHRYWCNPGQSQPMLSETGRDSHPWEDPMLQEAWDFANEQNIEPECIALPPQQATQGSSLIPPLHVTALSLKVVAWYLLRRGSLVSALGIGALVGGAALVGGKIVFAGFDLLQSAGELAALNDSLANRPASLRDG
jgi:hypothetical protein